MRLLIHDTLATAAVTVPLAAGWVEADASVPVEMVPGLTVADLRAEDLALLPSGEVPGCQETHWLVPEVAVVADGVGAVAMRTPVRPDEIAGGPVRLWQASSTAERVARATLRPFYGMAPTSWTADDAEAAEAQVVIVEGAEALRAPEAGFSEELCRAWYILTGLPTVGHVLVAPAGVERPAIEPALRLLEEIRARAHERRVELRRMLAETQQVEESAVHAFFGAQRPALTGADRGALLALLQRGARPGERVVSPRYVEVEES